MHKFPEIATRLKRAQGHLAAVIDMLEAGRPCMDLAQQLHAVEKAIAASNLGLAPSTEGQVLRLRIPELNEERRRELVKVAHKYAEAARVAVRHVRRDGLDVLKKLEKDHKISEDDGKRSAEQVQKATDEAIADIDRMLATKEKEVLTV